MCPIMSHRKGPFFPSLILNLRHFYYPSPGQEAAPLLDSKSVPPLIELDDVPKKKLESLYRVPSPEMIAYIDFNVSTTGVLSGVKVNSHFHVWC